MTNEIFSALNDKRSRQEYLTPSELIDVCYDLLGNTTGKVLFDCATGSGQLLFKHNGVKKGCEIGENSYKVALKNNVDCVLHDYITLDDINIQYDYVIANPPFSIRANEKQYNYLQSRYCFQFQKINKILDQWFVIKSFEKATKGVYILFPGLCYRQQEDLFRKYLINNNYLSSIYWFDSCLFEDKKVNVIVILLDKNKPNNNIAFRKYDDKYKLVKEETKTTEDIKKADYKLEPPYIEQKKEQIDIDAVENALYLEFLKGLQNDIGNFLFVKETLGGYKHFTKEQFKTDLMRIVDKIV